MEIMISNNVDGVFSDAYIFEEKPDNESRVRIKPGHYQGEEAVKDFLGANHIPFLTALVKKKTIQEINGFSGTPDIHEDYDLWLRLLINGHSLLGVDTPLAWYRVHAASSSSGEGKILFMDINTLQNIATTYPQYKMEAEHAIVSRINEYLAGNNISHWKMARGLLITRNRLAEKKISVSSWEWIYNILGKNIFRILFRIKNR